MRWDEKLSTLSHRPRPYYSEMKALKKYFKMNFLFSLSYIHFALLARLPRFGFLWERERRALKKNIQPDDIIYDHEFGAWRRALIWWIFALLYIIFFLLLFFIIIVRSFMLSNVTNSSRAADIERKNENDNASYISFGQRHWQ